MSHDESDPYALLEQVRTPPTASPRVPQTTSPVPTITRTPPRPLSPATTPPLNGASSTSESSYHSEARELLTALAKLFSQVDSGQPHATLTATLHTFKLVFRHFLEKVQSERGELVAQRTALKNSRQPLVEEVGRLREERKAWEGERENLMSEIEVLRAKRGLQVRASEFGDAVGDVAANAGDADDVRRLRELYKGAQGENMRLKSECEKMTKRCDAAAEDAERLKRQLAAAMDEIARMRNLVKGDTDSIEEPRGRSEQVTEVRPSKRGRSEERVPRTSAHRINPNRPLNNGERLSNIIPDKIPSPGAESSRRAPSRRSAYGEKQISTVLSGSQGEKSPPPPMTQMERAAAAKRLFERQATQRSRRELAPDERSATPPVGDVQSELERSVARSAEQERIRVEAMRLRNKLAQERLSALDPTVLHRLENLETRVHALTLELEGTRRYMSTLADMRLALEEKLPKAGAAALGVIAIKAGFLYARTANHAKAGKRRSVVLTEKSLYVFKDDEPTELVHSFDLRNSKLMYDEESILAVAPGSVNETEREGVVLQTDAGKSDASELTEWIKTISAAYTHAREPLAKYSLHQRHAMMPALRAHDYALALGVLYFTSRREEKYSVNAIHALLDIIAVEKDQDAFLRIVVTREIERTRTEKDIFRENTIFSRLLKVFCQRIGVRYLRATLAAPLQYIIHENKDLEIFADRLTDRSVLVQNRQNMAAAFQVIFDAIVRSLESIPPPIRLLCYYLWRAISDKFTSASPSVIGSFFFLRFICPAIAVPTSVGILDTPPSARLSRGLVLLTKVLQNMSNDVKFGQKEPDMIPLNALMTQNMSRFTAFLAQLPLNVRDGSTYASDRNGDRGYAQLREELSRHMPYLEPILQMVQQGAGKTGQ